MDPGGGTRCQREPGEDVIGARRQGREEELDLPSFTSRRQQKRSRRTSGDPLASCRRSRSEAAAADGSAQIVAL
jgi:hypothetical protein